MRIDKFLANLWVFSRKEIKKEIKNKNIFINDILLKKENEKINFWDKITVFWKDIFYKENIFVILNKLPNYVSSKVSEAWYKSIYELLENCPYKNILEICGRLDVDTTWLVLFTNNWEIIHKLTSPKKDIFKKYFVKSEKNLTENDIKNLEFWVIIDWNYKTKPVKIEQISENEIFLSITEWKFHQIKKMFEAIWNKVIKLERIEIWEIKIDNLKSWEWRFLEEKEINFLKNLQK